MKLNRKCPMLLKLRKDKFYFYAAVLYNYIFVLKKV